MLHLAAKLSYHGKLKKSIIIEKSLTRSAFVWFLWELDHAGVLIESYIGNKKK